jgi:hypothetical protein
MAVSGLLSSRVFSLSNNLASSQNHSRNKFQRIKQDFQQIGSALQYGNLSQAQSDFALLQQ